MSQPSSSSLSYSSAKYAPINKNTSCSRHAEGTSTTIINDSDEGVLAEAAAIARRKRNAGAAVVSGVSSTSGSGDGTASNHKRRMQSTPIGLYAHPHAAMVGKGAEGRSGDALVAPIATPSAADTAQRSATIAGGGGRGATDKMGTTNTMIGNASSATANSECTAKSNPIVAAEAKRSPSAGGRDVDGGIAAVGGRKARSGGDNATDDGEAAMYARDLDGRVVFLGERAGYGEGREGEGTTASSIDDGKGKKKVTTAAATATRTPLPTKAMPTPQLPPQPPTQTATITAPTTSTQPAQAKVPLQQQAEDQQQQQPHPYPDTPLETALAATFDATANAVSLASSYVSDKLTAVRMVAANALRPSHEELVRAAASEGRRERRVRRRMGQAVDGDLITAATVLVGKGDLLPSNTDTNTNTSAAGGAPANSPTTTNSYAGATKRLARLRRKLASFYQRQLKGGGLGADGGADGLKVSVADYGDVFSGGGGAGDAHGIASVGSGSLGAGVGGGGGRRSRGGGGGSSPFAGGGSRKSSGRRVPPAATSDPATTSNTQGAAQPKSAPTTAHRKSIRTATEELMIEERNEDFCTTAKAAGDAGGTASITPNSTPPPSSSTTTSDITTDTALLGYTPPFGTYQPLPSDALLEAHILAEDNTIAARVAAGGRGEGTTTPKKRKSPPITTDVKAVDAITAAIADTTHTMPSAAAVNAALSSSSAIVGAPEAKQPSDKKGSNADSAGKFHQRRRRRNSKRRANGRRMTAEAEAAQQRGGGIVGFFERIADKVVMAMDPRPMGMGPTVADVVHAEAAEAFGGGSDDTPSTATTTTTTAQAPARRLKKTATTSVIGGDAITAESLPTSTTTTTATPSTVHATTPRGTDAIMHTTPPLSIKEASAKAKRAAKRSNNQQQHHPTGRGVNAAATTTAPAVAKPFKQGKAAVMLKRKSPLTLVIRGDESGGNANSGVLPSSRKENATKKRVLKGAKAITTVAKSGKRGASLPLSSATLTRRSPHHHHCKPVIKSAKKKVKRAATSKRSTTKAKKQQGSAKNEK